MMKALILTMIFLINKSTSENVDNLCIFNNLSGHDLCPRHLNLSRKEMPQIEGDEFLNYLYYNSEILSSWCTSVSPSYFTSAQKQIHTPLVTNLIIDLSENGQKEPIFVSTDGYILDGHHRWAALDTLGIDVKVVMIDLPISNLLKLAHLFSIGSHH
jgi:hypothetical protein